MLGIPLLYFKGMRLLMFQLSGFYYTVSGFRCAVQGLEVGVGDSCNPTSPLRTQCKTCRLISECRSSAPGSLKLDSRLKHFLKPESGEAVVLRSASSVQWPREALWDF